MVGFTAVRVGRAVRERNYSTIWVAPETVRHIGVNNGGYAQLTVESGGGHLLDYHIVGMTSDEVGALLGFCKPPQSRL